MKVLLKKLLSIFGYRMECIKSRPHQLQNSLLCRELEFDDVVCRLMAEAGSQLNFIQVGVYDGVTHDPLHKYIRKFDWSGVLVEPQSQSAEHLRKLYGDYKNVIVFQAALDAGKEKKILYTLEEQGAPEWAGGLASLQRENIMKHEDLIPGLASMIREEHVDCVDFDQVFDKLGSESVDILQIDTEGADDYVLSLFPFDRVKPAIIQWEIKHLSKAQQEECLNCLSGYGYRFASSGAEDMMAMQF